MTKPKQDKDDDVKGLTVRVPASLHREIKIKAAREGVAVGNVVIGLLKKWAKEGLRL